MTMNPRLAQLQPYPFERLAALKAGTTPPAALPHIALSIGEPQHPAPDFVVRTLVEKLGGLSNYPTTKGIPALREAIAGWCNRRFHLAQPLDAETQVLPVNGTREALFAFAQAVVDASADPLVVSPNPFYQIYEGAALLAGATPHFLNCSAANGFIPDFASVPAAVWQRCQLLFICTPGNPTGSVMSLEQLQQLIAVKALQPAGPALGVCRWRCGHPRTVPAVPHLPRLCDAVAAPVRQHRCLER
jgi:N-succinyldiaminopimelate aminotransferase